MPVAGENGTELYTKEEIAEMVAAEVAGLKANQAELLKEAKKAKDALKNYEGVDPVRFKELEAAAVEAERKRAEAQGDFKSLEKQLIDRHQAELGVKDSKITKLSTALEKRLIDAQLAEAIARAGAKPAFVPLLKLEGRQFVRVKETDEDYDSFVVDERGNPLVADGKGTPMTVDLLVEQTLKTKYPDAFMGSGSSGGGAAKSSGGAGGQTKTISAGDNQAFLANIDQILDGSVKVA
jgi:hypothetical protein